MATAATSLPLCMSVHVFGYTCVCMYVNVRGEPQIILRHSLTFNFLTREGSLSDSLGTFQ